MDSTELGLEKVEAFMALLNKLVKEDILKNSATGKAQVYITGIGGVAHHVPLNGNRLLYQSLSFPVQ